MKKWRQKEFLRTWECLNCKKSSQLFSWETRSFAKCFRDYILLWASEGAKVLFGEPVYVVVQFCSCATCTSPILHLICPAKFCTSIVFNFSWDSCNTQEKWKEKKKKRLCKNFGRQIRCFMGDVQVAYGLISIFLCSLSCLNYHTQKQRKIKLKNKDKIEPQHRQVRKRRNEEGETK